jgi:hypothetical protein
MKEPSMTIAAMNPNIESHEGTRFDRLSATQNRTVATSKEYIPTKTVPPMPAWTNVLAIGIPTNEAVLEFICTAAGATVMTAPMASPAMPIIAIPCAVLPSIPSGSRDRSSLKNQIRHQQPTINTTAEKRKVASYQTVTKVNAEVAPKVMAPEAEPATEGRRQHGRTKAG